MGEAKVFIELGGHVQLFGGSDSQSRGLKPDLRNTVGARPEPDRFDLSGNVTL
jgi:hypothetical protein